MAEQAKKKKRGKIALYIVYGALTVFVLVLILSLNNIGEILDTLATAHVGYVFAALGMLLLYLALSPLSLCMLTRSRKNKISFGKTYVIGMTEHFFNGITPFSTGGQPFQAYSYARSGVKVSESTSLLIMNFLVMMIASNIFAACALFYFTRFALNAAMTVVAIVGFSINFAVLLCTVVIATSKTVRRFLMWCVRLLCKIKFIGKFLKPQEEKLAAYFEQVQIVFKDLAKKPITFTGCLVAKLAAFAAQYAITFFIIRALHIDVGWDQMFFVMCGTAFATTMCVFLPTPGASGGVELAFAMVFSSIIGTSTEPGSVAYGGMLMWRLMTYYLAMLISLMFYLGFEIQYNVARRRGEAIEVAEEADGQPVPATESAQPELPDVEMPAETEEPAPAETGNAESAEITETALNPVPETAAVTENDAVEAHEENAAPEENENTGKGEQF